LERKKLPKLWGALSGVKGDGKGEGKKQNVNVRDLIVD
jgi:hypothetical protein